jgi:hypothetical protein
VGDVVEDIHRGGGVLFIGSEAVMAIDDGERLERILWDNDGY